MIEHLKGRKKALEALGWTGRETEWMDLVRIQSGIFILVQYRYFCHDTLHVGAHRMPIRYG